MARGQLVDPMDPGRWSKVNEKRLMNEKANEKVNEEADDEVDEKAHLKQSGRNGQA